MPDSGLICRRVAGRITPAGESGLGTVAGVAPLGCRPGFRSLPGSLDALRCLSVPFDYMGLSLMFAGQLTHTDASSGTGEVATFSRILVSRRRRARGRPYRCAFQTYLRLPRYLAEQCRRCSTGPTWLS